MGCGGFQFKVKKGACTSFRLESGGGLVIASILGYFGQSKDQGIWIESRGHIYDA